MIRHGRWQRPDDNDDRNAVYWWLTFISLFIANNKTKLYGPFRSNTYYYNSRNNLWNLSFHICLCFTTESFTVSVKYFLTYFYFLLSSKLHGKTSRAYQDTDSHASPNENDDHLSVKSLDEVIESFEPKSDNPLTSPESNNRDKKAYLKALERSLRTGRRIQDEEVDNTNENESPANPLNFISRFINKYIRRKTTDNHEIT